MCSLIDYLCVHCTKFSRLLHYLILLPNRMIIFFLWQNSSVNISFLALVISRIHFNAKHDCKKISGPIEKLLLLVYDSMIIVIFLLDKKKYYPVLSMWIILQWLYDHILTKKREFLYKKNYTLQKTITIW